MKVGATRSDQNKINRYAGEGMTAEEISKLLAIKLECVESFMPAKPKAKRKAKADTDETEG